MLLRGGAVRISDTEELISINNTTSRPRSAIGYTAAGRVVLLAVEGSGAGYPGINLVDLASMLGSLGCTDAINLDGGGSTSLVIGNQLTVRPGDNGVERPVISALLIKQR
jgi:exopolysaccharide biosynthesis protein